MISYNKSDVPDVNTLIIRLLYLIAEADNNVDPRETKLIEALRVEYEVSKLSLERILKYDIDDILRCIPVYDLKHHSSVFINLVKADGVILPEELKIFNYIQNYIFTGKV